MTQQDQLMTFDDAAAMGLSCDEWELILKRLERTPNQCELGIFSAMWSEHCSYKSSKKWLKTLPVDGPQVIEGPGENAGAVDIGDGLAAIFKIESHNHPSFIEPYQGAATGVGGILRDVFTMGARPVALLNALRFGAAGHEKTRHLLSGVVAGIGGYGNCIGIPTVGGEVNFDKSYNGNILVNAMAVGLANSDRIFRSAATGPGNPVIYVGAKTGRDGIHGATMASTEFSDETESKRPTVQVGDPFTGKLLMEACLELMASDSVLSIQDMGAAGLTSSSVEMASKGGLGMEIDLDLVPAREDGMTAYELMLSESQERMLMVLKPDATETARAIFDKWDLDFMPIGQVTETGRLVLLKDRGTACDIPLAPLVDDAPEYDRPQNPVPDRLRAIRVAADPGNGMAGLCPQRLQRCSPAVDQLELRGIHHNAPISPRHRNAGHRFSKPDRLGTSQDIGDMFGRHLQDSARLFTKEPRIGLIGRAIEIHLQPAAPRKCHLQQSDQQATVRAVVVGKHPIVVLDLLHQLEERVNVLRDDVGSRAAHLLPHLREHRATHSVLPAAQIDQQ